MEQFDRNELIEQRRLRRMELQRKRKMQQRIIIGALAALLVILLIIIIKGCGKDDNNRHNHEESEIPPITVEPEEKPDNVNTTVTLSAVGDIMMYESQIKAGQINENTYDFSDSFRAVMAYTVGADLTVGNLELNFLGYAPYSGDPQSAIGFNCPEVLATNLHDIGFDVLQTANTYSIMNGIAGLQSTINFLNQASIDHTGTHISNPADSGSGGIVLREVNGVKIAFIGFTKGLNGMTLPNNNLYSVDLLYNDYNTTYENVNISAITSRIDAAKNTNPDVIIAMVHWGSEYDLAISKTQEEIRDLMFKNGVDVILGSHSHVVGPMETMEVKTVDGEKKTCFVAYSLGNFISDMSKPYTQESVVLNLEFTKDGTTGDTQITNINYVPLYILDRGEDATETRFEVLPIREAIKSSNFEEYEDLMTTAIDNLKVNTQSDYDSGR